MSDYAVFGSVQTQFSVTHEYFLCILVCVWWDVKPYSTTVYFGVLGLVVSMFYHLDRECTVFIADVKYVMYTCRTVERTNVTAGLYNVP